MKTSCIIIDDEPLAIRVIEKHIEKLPEFNIIAKCKNAIQAIEVLKNENVDLLFLDIQMPELTGLEFLKTLQNPPSIIITTAYRNYAVDAFDLDVLDYLLKPITFERFLKAINKFYHSKNSIKQIIKETKVQESDNTEYINIKKGKTIIRILLSDIQYIESFKDNIVIHTSDDSFTTKKQIGNFEEELPGENFIRVHKSFIIAIKYIKSISPTNIGLKNKDIPLGRSYKSYVLNRLDYK
ncbi:LytR/AlgR family response regulator transcription factor [Bacteroidota bacterium]